LVVSRGKYPLVLELNKMNIKKGIEINWSKWNFVFGFVPTYYRYDCFEFYFGFFKIKLLPPAGEVISRKHYKGFLFRWDFKGFGFTINN